MCSPFAAGTRIIFTAYMDAEMPETQHIFRPGDFGVVAKVNDDGGLQCFPTDEDGKVTSLEGDTLFPEEIIPLAYAPKVNITVSVG